MNEQPTDMVIQALLKDRKRDRLWRNIRFGLGSLLLVIFVLTIIGLTSSKDADDTAIDPNKPYVAVVKLDGEVQSGAPFSARKAIPQIQKAFNDKKARAVILLIDSPGGSPVNASQIYHEILRQKKLHPQTPVVAVGEDLLTSAAYLVAVAAETIYVNDNTIAGSIGVVSSGFGFTQAMEKLGIERRAFTSGIHKDRLDPFKPLEKEDTDKIQKVLTLVHTNFINLVKNARGSKLKGDSAELFSGDFWTGSEAVKLGLVDATGDLEDVMHLFKVDQYLTYAPKQSLWRQLMRDMGEETSFRLHNYLNPLHAAF